MASLADDRRFVIDQFEYLFGRPPTAAEVDQQVAYLQRGMTRTAWMANNERISTQAAPAVTRLYQSILGRAPSPERLAYYARMLTSGKMTRKSLQEHLAGTSEALLRKPTAAPDPEAENARTYLADVLKSYGLDGMGDWAWDQIQAGHNPQRILQNLRETDQYKQRFVGMAKRQAAGLPAISEAEYIAYESSVRQMMRAAGMPSDFYDQPDDFGNLIGNDVSAAEMQSRINDGYLAASQADPTVRQQLRDLYGVGESQLAAFFLDPDRALPLIQRQFTASQISAAGQRAGYGALNAGEAENLAGLGVTEQQAVQGFGALAENAELFQAIPGEDQEGLISRETQQAAVFGGDALARQQIERRAGARRSAGSGAQAFQVGQEGVAGLSRR